ncbi:hypothetical protein EXIGLDRAFT_711207 [Exidia glandulosa HHB12029]|uniref:Helitron helicase-like domain-containing protein n=1 Tax=Exidia glandulosa HHB12029 TaxID=1314781 RepID=A0A165QDY0_EXIGL|nr:hypothetical protein EXIGLDRAFT_711207 [Exidia glandulosa HHB12029]
MYHDKRFQFDKEFAIMAFNQEQVVKGSQAGVFLSSKSKYQRLVDLILSLNIDVFINLADKLVHSPNTKPETAEESACFRVLSELDMVNAHVPGSITAKRYQRNELWSLLAYQGAPSWFVTFSPADVRHPLCLYYASSDREFDARQISLLDPATKWYRVANNAVASARFFHYVVEAFIAEILKWKTASTGLFGETNAFYGTVEQQGQLQLIIFSRKPTGISVEIAVGLMASEFVRAGFLEN